MCAGSSEYIGARAGKCGGFTDESRTALGVGFRTSEYEDFPAFIGRAGRLRKLPHTLPHYPQKNFAPGS